LADFAVFGAEVFADEVFFGACFVEAGSRFGALFELPPERVEPPFLVDLELTIFMVHRLRKT
jgi:hypothetical protein